MLRHVVAHGCRAGDQQRGACLDHDAVRNAVDVAQIFFGHAHAPRRIDRLHAARRLPGHPGGQLRVPLGQQVGREDRGIVPGQQDLGSAGGQDHRAVQRGVERPEIIDIHFGEPRGQCDVDIAVDRHGLEIRVVLDDRQCRAVGLRGCHQVLDRLELGHIHARLRRHAELGVAGPQARGPVARNGAANAAFAPVVGSQRQVPVTEHPVQLLQVVQGRPRGGQHVPAVVTKGVLCQLETFPGGGHELPHAGRLGTGHGLGVEGALDEGQQRQLGGHVAPLQFLDDMEQVLAPALGHACHVVGPRRIPLLAVPHQIVLKVGHREPPPDALPQVGGRREHGHGQ